MSRICYNCKSSDIKAIDAIRTQLRNEVSLGTGFGGVGKSGLGIGGAITSGKVASTLVKDIEKRMPKKHSIIKILIFIFLTFLFFSIARQPDSDDGLFYILSSICFIVVIFFIWGRIKYPSKLDYYLRTWYCFKCGKYSIFKK